MPKEISQKTREQRISRFIKRWKFLYDKKYYKTNKISCAAYDSWAARGQAGGCRICNCNHYNFTIHNKRFTRQNRWSFQYISKLCSKCYYEVEKQCNYVFKKY